jgi:hypothetical protein
MARLVCVFSSDTNECLCVSGGSVNLVVLRPTNHHESLPVSLRMTYLRLYLTLRVFVFSLQSHFNLNYAHMCIHTHTHTQTHTHAHTHNLTHKHKHAHTHKHTHTHTHKHIHTFIYLFMNWNWGSNIISLFCLWPSLLAPCQSYLQPTKRNLSRSEESVVFILLTTTPLHTQHSG